MSFTVRGYGRASTDHQVLSTEQQEARIKEAFAYKQSSRPEWSDAQWGGFFADEATGRETCFRERHFASLLLAASQPGDYILVSNFDRLVAGVKDSWETAEYVESSGLKLAILDFGGMEVDTSSAYGRFFFVLMAQLKQLEVHDIRRRVREMNAHRNRVGLPCVGRLIGWQTVAVMESGRIRHYWQEDHVARRFGYDLLTQFTAWRKPLCHAYQFANSLGLKQLDGRRWTEFTYGKWIRAAQAGFPLPNGSHDAAPIPADAKPVNLHTITADV